MVRNYFRWDKILDEHLKPIEYNSLTNLDLRKRTLNLIPKSIHQVWLKETPLPEQSEKLQQTIKQVYKDYKYTLWGIERLNPYDFPLSYHLIARVLDYQSRSNR